MYRVLLTVGFCWEATSWLFGMVIERATRVNRIIGITCEQRNQLTSELNYLSHEPEY